MLFRIGAVAIVSIAFGAPPTDRLRIPRIWDDRDIAEMEIPLAHPEYSPRHPPAEYYYRIPVRPIYRSYPVNGPGRAAAGYIEALKQKEPELIFDAARLRSLEDCSRVGEAVFDAATGYDDPFTVEDTLDPEWWAAVKPPVGRDGALAGLAYIVRKKGKVELGSLSCGNCHTRVLADGTVVRGGQGNFPFDRALAWRDRRSKIETVRNGFLMLFTAQWLPSRQQTLATMTLEELASARDAIPPGVLARNRSSVFHPPAVPDLFGVRQRKYRISPAWWCSDRSRV